MGPAKQSAAAGRPVKGVQVVKQPRMRLHVSGLPRELLEDELRARFTPFGAVRSVEVMREKENSPFLRDDTDSDESSSDDDSSE